MSSKKAASATKLAMKIPAAVGDEAIVSITTSATSSGALAATDPAILADILQSSLSSDTPATGASAVLGEAAASAQPGQEPNLPPPPPNSGLPIPEQDQAPQPAVVGVDLAAGSDTSAYWRLDAAGNFEGVVSDPTSWPVPAPIHDLADARALPDVGSAVYVRPTFDSPLAIRAFKDHDGHSMAVVWTGTTLAKAAITD